MTTTVDISPDAVERLAVGMQYNGRQDVTDMLRALRSAMTASEKDSARYRWLREQTERTVSPYMACVAKYKLNCDSSDWVNVADLNSVVDAAMEKANG